MNSLSHISVKHKISMFDENTKGYTKESLFTIQRQLSMYKLRKSASQINSTDSLDSTDSLWGCEEASPMTELSPGSWLDSTGSGAVLTNVVWSAGSRWPNVDSPTSNLSLTILMSERSTPDCISFYLSLNNTAFRFLASLDRSRHMWTNRSRDALLLNTVVTSVALRNLTRRWSETISSAVILAQSVDISYRVCWKGFYDRWQCLCYFLKILELPLGPMNARLTLCNPRDNKVIALVFVSIIHNWSWLTTKVLWMSRSGASCLIDLCWAILSNVRIAHPTSFSRRSRREAWL